LIFGIIDLIIAIFSRLNNNLRGDVPMTKKLGNLYNKVTSNITFKAVILLLSLGLFPQAGA